jgi:hypothetical protein
MAIREANALSHYAPRPADGDHCPPSAWRELGPPPKLMARSRPLNPTLRALARYAATSRRISRATRRAVFCRTRQPDNAVQDTER